ncbi:hypothetical protein COLO4_28934 [Corchorus olitorius]|uniref:EGF-like domain-containing protein n=1 Tax=Corchorus olitorius TaxID=93759 RepID=A0A1R3HHJ2_9ROSI|nr:hypothetical protein COLO4_28934 [Corchorus olitorius]
MILKEKIISIYILYAREGLWSIGFRHPVLNSGSPLPNSTMSFSLEDCPNQCSNHGICKTYQAAGGSTSYSSCSCDRYHGGFACSINVVSKEGQKWQKMLLVFSNAAALLPAFWALWKNAWAESVIFLASGVISAIYHACDIDWWCALRFSVLQFMDFWLSFMAVVSVFVYLALISEPSKRTIHTIVAISTALIAVIDPTRALN